MCGVITAMYTWVNVGKCAAIGCNDWEKLSPVDHIVIRRAFSRRRCLWHYYTSADNAARVKKGLGMQKELYISLRE